jgi:hypothetical protein
MGRSRCKSRDHFSETLYPRRVVPPAWKRAFFFGPATLVTLGLSVLTFARARPGGYDDPYILLVYVRHLAQSGSIYWNAEEGPVDGCTSMLDLVVKTGIYKLLEGGQSEARAGALRLLSPGSSDSPAHTATL